VVLPADYGTASTLEEIRDDRSIVFSALGVAAWRNSSIRKRQWGSQESSLERVTRTLVLAMFELAKEGR